MDEAEYCHRLALMHRGRIVALGNPAALKKELQVHSLLNLDSSDPLESMRILETLRNVHEVAVFGGGLHISVLDPDEAQVEIREALQKNNIAIRNIEMIEPSMEDIFVATIEKEEKKDYEP
jgi:ABC-2 type transport system ATP-binding protein